MHPAAGIRCAPGTAAHWERLHTVLFVLTTFFLSFLPTEILFQRLEGRAVKLAVWASLLGLSLAVVLFRMPQTFDWSSPRRFVFASFILFSIYSALQAWIRPPPFNYQQTLVTVFLVPLFALMGMLSARHKKTVINTLLCLSGFYVMSGIIGLHTGYLIYQGEGFQTVVPSQLYEHQNVGYQGSSSYVGIFLLILLTWCWFNTRSVGSRLLVMVSCAYSLILLFVLGGRAASLAVTASLLFVVLVKLIPVVLCLPINRRDVLWLFCLGCLTALAVRVALLPNMHVVRRFAVLLEERDASMRGFLFTEAISLWSRDIWTLFVGIGPQAFPEAIGAESAGKYPHNFILEALCEYGVLGCVLLCAPLVVIARTYARGILRVGSSRNATIALGAITVFFFIQSMGTGALQSIWPLIFLMAALVPGPDVPDGIDCKGQGLGGT